MSDHQRATSPRRQAPVRFLAAMFTLLASGLAFGDEAGFVTTVESDKSASIDHIVVDADAAGNTLVSGGFGPPSSFAPITIVRFGAITWYFPYPWQYWSRTGFLGKLDPEGNFLWVKIF